jgi:hypothetical protein
MGALYGKRERAKAKSVGERKVEESTREGGRERAEGKRSRADEGRKGRKRKRGR